jgi:hypothetical protein
MYTGQHSPTTAGQVSRGGRYTLHSNPCLEIYIYSGNYLPLLTFLTPLLLYYSSLLIHIFYQSQII